MCYKCKYIFFTLKHIITCIYRCKSLPFKIVADLENSNLKKFS